jgi:hypothetical protein
MFVILTVKQTEISKFGVSSIFRQGIYWSKVCTYRYNSLAGTTFAEVLFNKLKKTKWDYNKLQILPRTNKVLHYKINFNQINFTIVMIMNNILNIM